MKSARETLNLSAPLRDVRLARSGERDTLHRLDLQASYERGRRDGEHALSEQLVRQRAEVLELQTGILTSLQSSIPAVVRDCERALAQLALEAAQKLVSGLPISVEMIEALVRETCAQVEDTADFTVQLHSDDLALLERTHSPLLLAKSGEGRVSFQASAHVARGGCMVQTRFGVIDARRETRLELLRATVAA